MSANIAFFIAAWIIIGLMTWAIIRGAREEQKPRVKVSLKVKGEELITNEYLAAALRGEA